MDLSDLATVKLTPEGEGPAAVMEAVLEPYIATSAIVVSKDGESFVLVGGHSTLELIIGELKVAAAQYLDAMEGPES